MSVTQVEHGVRSLGGTAQAPVLDGGTELATLVAPNLREQHPDGGDSFRSSVPLGAERARDLLPDEVPTR